MRTRICLLLCSIFTATLLPAFAQQDSTRIAVIDLRKCFDQYWKTKQADSSLKEEAGSLDKERKTLLDQYQRSQDTYKKLLDSANDQAVSTEERDRRKKSAESELLRLKEIQTNIEQFDRQARTTLGEKQRRMRDNILGEIREVIKAKAKGGNFSLVLDIAGESVNNTPLILYSAGENDLTEVVIAQLNANAPAGTTGTSEAKPDKAK